MDCLRCFAKLLFESHNVSLKGVYNDCEMRYNTIAVETVSVYSKKPRTGIQRQKISLNSVKKTQNGTPLL